MEPSLTDTDQSLAVLKILVVEDDPGIEALVSLGLRYEKFDVMSCANGLESLRLIDEFKPDLLILDWMLPGMDGLSVCKRVRATSDMPIIMMTARDAVVDRVSGLEGGADDYLVKPFHIDELIARVKVRLRRKAPVAAQLQFQDLVLDPDSHEAMRGRERLALTGTEFKLLTYFLRHPRQVLSKEAILTEVWGYDFNGDANIIEQYIRSLRTKMGLPALIQTVRGAGYVLREE